ncbi:MAG: hypothetical protein GXY81_07280 [Candidatus Cloacimonetes bacterium]|nr:hypothetical protein [Candidatus Cloacimonadota bacterium]
MKHASVFLVWVKPGSLDQKDDLLIMIFSLKFAGTGLMVKPKMGLQYGGIFTDRFLQDFVKVGRIILAIRQLRKKSV